MTTSPHRISDCALIKPLLTHSTVEPDRNIHGSFSLTPISDQDVINAALLSLSPVSRLTISALNFQTHDKSAPEPLWPS